MLITRNTTDRILLDRGMTDLLKFLSCIMIALHHYSQGMVVAGSHNPIYQLLSTQGGWLGVAVFFFLSGYGLMKSDMKNHLKLFPFLKKRLLKTYLPAVFVSFLWGGYLIITKKVSFNLSWVKGVLWNFNDEVLWFVRIIIILYLTFYVYCVVHKIIGKYYSRSFADIFLLLIFSISSYVFLCHIIGFVHGSSVLLFFLGMSIAKYNFYYLKLIRKIYPILLVFTIIILLTFIKRHDAEWIHLLINYFCIFSAIVLFAFFNLRIQVPKLMGEISYDVYLVHNKFLLILKSIYTVAPLWQFVVFTIMGSLLFHKTRKLFQI